MKLMKEVITTTGIGIMKLYLFLFLIPFSIIGFLMYRRDIT